MSSLAATQADGYYLPPEYHESGAKNKNEWHARQSGQHKQQKTTVRFELADPCVCLKCNARIGRGTRFNAVKIITGESYHSTPIHEFSTKCRRCGAGEFVIRTDPKHRGFAYSGDLRAQVREWEATDVHGLTVEQSDGSDNEDKKKSPMDALQDEKQARRLAATEREELEQLLQRNEQTVGNDAAQNATIRQTFREDRRERKHRQRQAARKGWKDSLTLLASSVVDASEAASQVFGNAKSQQQKRWKKVREASIFDTGLRTKAVQPDPVASAAGATTTTNNQQTTTAPPPRRKKRRIVIGTGGSISLGVMLSLMTVIMYFWEIKTHHNDTTSALHLVPSSPRYTVDMAHNDPHVRSLSQAACHYLWAPSSIHGWGVFTTHDIARKTVGQPYPDVCFFIPRAFLPKHDDNTVVPVTALSGLTQEDKEILVCQGFVSLMNHMPNDMANRVTPTSVLIPLGNLTSISMKSDKPFSVTTFSQRKVKVGAELTTTYMGTTVKPTVHNVKPEVDPIWLRQEGWCLDGLDFTAEGTPVASRPLSLGELLVASPILRLRNVPSDHPVRVYCLNSTKKENDGTTTDLLFPYGPGLGLLSRFMYEQKDFLTPNVGLRWYTPDILQLYALRPIGQGNVIVLKRGNQSPPEISHPQDE
jgi:coiled-coil domain-containing protein 130